MVALNDEELAKVNSAWTTVGTSETEMLDIAIVVVQALPSGPPSCRSYSRPADGC